MLPAATVVRPDWWIHLFLSPTQALQCKRERKENSYVQPHSVLQLTADSIRGKNGPGTSTSRSVRLCTAQEALPTFPKCFSLSCKYLKEYQWLNTSEYKMLLEKAITDACAGAAGSSSPSLLSHALLCIALWCRPSLRFQALVRVLQQPDTGSSSWFITVSPSIKHGTSLKLSFLRGSGNYLFVNGKGNCFQGTLMAEWPLSCKVENKSTPCRVLRGSWESSGPNSSCDNFKDQKQRQQEKQQRRPPNLGRLGGRPRPEAGLRLELAWNSPRSGSLYVSHCHLSFPNVDTIWGMWVWI